MVWHREHCNLLRISTSLPPQTGQAARGGLRGGASWADAPSRGGVDPQGCRCVMRGAYLYREAEVAKYPQVSDR